MGTSDSSKTGNQSFSWEGGELNTKPISAQGLNSGLRSDMQAAYLKGPTQQSYVGMSNAMRDRMTNLTGAAAQNSGLLDTAIGQAQGTVQSGGLTPEQRAAMGGMQESLAGQRGLLGSYQDTIDSGGLNADQRAAMAGMQATRGRYDDMYARGAAGNPELDNIIRQTNDRTYADVMASLGSTGAVGSNIHMNELGGALADNESRLRYQDFGDSFNRQGSALAGAMGVDTSLFGMGQTGQGNVAGAQAGLGNTYNAMQGINTGIFNMGQAGQANAANAAGQLPGLYDAYMTPQRMAVAEQGMLDTDQQQRAAFDPNLNHIAQYQGLLGANSAGPQPAGLMDYLKLIGGTAAAIL